MSSPHAYISDMKARGVQFRFDMPSSVQDKSKSAMLTENIQGMMEEVAVRAGFIAHASAWPQNRRDG